MNSLISETADRIIAGGFDPRTSPWAHRVCVMLLTAQGLIDNGGLDYFFGNEFEGDPDMNDFPRVYDAVGAKMSAAALKEALARAKGGAANYEDLNDLLWNESEHNYDLLEEYILAHAANYA